MDYFFINTDSFARKDVETCDLWFKYGMAFSGGDKIKYGIPLLKIKSDDICLMYHNEIGITAVGYALETWDEKSWNQKQKLVYVDQDIDEYRIKVDWYIDLRKKPIDPIQNLGYNPRGLLQPIKKHKGRIIELIKTLEYESEIEICNSANLVEGSIHQLYVSIYERSPLARKKCIEHYGTKCFVCDFDFSFTYGTLGKGFIHVHHLDKISEQKETHPIDPIKDLRPICPNCHAMIHKNKTPISIDELRQLLLDNKINNSH